MQLDTMFISKFGKSIFSVYIFASIAITGLALKLHDTAPPTVSAVSPTTQGFGGPILVITSALNPFSQYYAEILRTEGLNAFHAIDILQVTAATLSAYDIVILGEMPLSIRPVTILSDWVHNGGNLIAMRPDKKLASLLGLVDAFATLSNAYLLVERINLVDFSRSTPVCPLLPQTELTVSRGAIMPPNPRWSSIMESAWTRITIIIHRLGAL